MDYCCVFQRLERWGNGDGGSICCNVQKESLSRREIDFREITRGTIDPPGFRTTGGPFGREPEEGLNSGASIIEDLDAVASCCVCIININLNILNVDHDRGGVTNKVESRDGNNFRGVWRNFTSNCYSGIASRIKKNTKT